jgi:hypothetical protein
MKISVRFPIMSFALTTSKSQGVPLNIHRNFIERSMYKSGLSFYADLYFPPQFKTNHCRKVNLFKYIVNSAQFDNENISIISLYIRFVFWSFDTIIIGMSSLIIKLMTWIRNNILGIILNPVFLLAHHFTSIALCYYVLTS